MAKKTVLDVGNCGPDHSAISRMLNEHFDVRILRSHLVDDTLEVLKDQSVDLVLINRKLDQDYSDGILIVERIKGDENFQSIPVMLVTNLEEHQTAAIQAGAERGLESWR